MIREYIKYSLATLLLLMAVYGTQAQVSTLYNMENVATRHELNPAFQPISNVYIDLPVPPSLYMSFGNNSMSLYDVVRPIKQADGTFKTEWMLNSDDFYNQLKDVTRIHTESDLGLFGFGFRVKHSYITFGFKLRSSTGIYLPKDLFTLPLQGAGENGREFNLDRLAFNATSYAEAALGYSLEVNERLNVGAKVKALFGIANTSLEMNRFRINASRQRWNFDLDATANMSIPFDAKYIESEDARRIHKIEYGEPESTSDWVNGILKPQGMGAAIDLGATYKLFNDRLTLSAAVLDLGFIKWKQAGSANMPVSANFDYEGVELKVEDGKITDMDGNTDWFDKYGDMLEDSIQYTTTYNGYSTALASKVMLGAEYSLLNEKLSVGLLSKSTIINKTLYEEVTASLNLLPVSWFNLSASYSLINGGMGVFGLGVGGRLGPFNLYVASDYLPLQYTKAIDLGGLSTPVPYKFKTFNFQFGMMWTFGNGNSRKKDDDRDGVRNGWDKCPNTPASYLVDKRGCIVDADGDGVADNVDRCPDTPSGTAVDANGCPLDGDGDGVPDYLDKCPDTPTGVAVDADGCPFDADGDSIPDYLDKCPDTPAGVNVDRDGCPVDSDGDKVPDYLDKCPDTPLDVAVDETGCPFDADGDSIPDYLDKCPDTPVAARGYVDETGCPKDTDEDGIPDYLDVCPTIKGVAENKGCPAVKATVKKIFEKALQGIQFENGKDVIKKESFPILNEIVKAMKENPEYLLNISGHTDNVGSPASNQVLSEKRANSVKNYLEKGGIDASRLTALGFGDTQPVVPNTTAANKAKNRRVEFVVRFEATVEE
jgi:outer membrane protein OmpA-like peptidoglycan-associated protein